jgi:3-oxoacyl-[acyl-carrier protein] reductase
MIYKDLANKTALITGASQGIGKAIALEFSQQKTNSLLVSRDKKKLLKVFNKIKKRTKNSQIYSCNLQNDYELYSFLKKIKKCPDFIIHNIGGTLNIKSPYSSYEDWLKVINFNFGIAVKINNFFLKDMIKRKSGRIVHISSISAVSLRGSAPYAASKSLLNSYVQTLARSIAKNNISVCAILPGALYSKGGHWDNVKKNNIAMYKDFLRHHHAIGRLGFPQEISPWVVFYCSKNVTNFSTGALINIDGGTM